MRCELHRESERSRRLSRSSTDSTINSMANSQPHQPEWTLIRRGSSRTAPIVLGESPCWDPRSNRLLFVDIESGCVHRLDPASGRSESITLPKGTLLGAVGLVETSSCTDGDGSACCWLTSNHGVHLLSWTSARSTLLHANPDAPDTRFNDAKVSPHGDLIAGTIVTESNAAKRKGRGHLFRLSSDPFASMGCANRLSSQILLKGATLSNGMDFDSDREPTTGEKRLWWIDSAVPKVQCFHMHGRAAAAAAPCRCSSAAASPAASACACASAGCSCCSVALPTASSGPVCLTLLDRCIQTSGDGAGSLSLGGVPDGMTLDAEGCAWVALSGSGIVARYSSTGQLLRAIRFPVSKVTSVCFGGSSMRTLFVTSAAKGVDLTKEPLAGSVFSVADAGVAGRPMHRLRGRFTLADSSPTEGVQHRLVEDIPAATTTTRSKL